jgi:hypothetical protein
MRRRLALPLCAAALALLAPAAPAGADVFGPISLVSASATEQAQYAHDPVISGDGRYIAFDGMFDGLTGVWRRNLESRGPVEPVAVGEPGTPEGSAELPSISEDGRYISFTTTARLDPAEDTNYAPDVYVRDMENPNDEACVSASEEDPSPPACAFELASAVNGSAQGLTYSYGANPSSEEVLYGAVASGRSALTANGREVVFVTTAVSDLAGPNTPAPQVAVRNLEEKTTQLVSVAYDPATGGPEFNSETGQPEPVSAHVGGATYGAVYTGQAHAPAFRLPPAYSITPPVGASISADGSTVAWMGVDIGEQAPLLAGESRPANYTEPLWRDIGDGPEAPTRRVTGGSDPSAPACIASGETTLAPEPSLSDPCQGPFVTAQEVESGIWTGDIGDVVPRLSAEGCTIAFVANAPLVSLGLDFGGGSNNNDDLYLVNMCEAVTRSQALRPITELGSGDQANIATNGPIAEFAISANGTQVAFTTKRTEFPLGSPAYVSAPAAVPGMNELFEADLLDDTLTRVTHGYEGGASEHPHPPTSAGEDPYELPYDGALSPSFTDNGQTLAFSSTASNLVYGDGNTPLTEGSGTFDGSDAFVVSRKLFSPEATEDYVSAAPASPPLAPPWALEATTFSHKNGSVSLYIEVPGAGTLSADAQSAVLVAKARPARRARRASSRRGHAVRATRAAAKGRVATRTVATATAHPHGSGLVVVTLSLAKAYAALAGESGGLSSTVTLVLTASGHPAAKLSIPVTFVGAVKRSRTSKAARRSSFAKTHRKKARKDPHR